jgi:tetratricopeptide (TPR) repeat protein
MRRSLFFLLFSFLFLQSARADSYLVLPFSNLSASSENLEWISESISETIREALYGRGLVVIDRQDRHEAYRRLSIKRNARLTHASVMKMAEALDAGTVIYGEFQLLPDAHAAGNSRGSLRITARVIEMKRLRQAPVLSETGALEELAALQSHLAWEVIRLAAPQVAPPEEEFRRDHPPVRLDAMENYIRGLLAQVPDQKHRFFTQAVRLDENFSKPYFELGRLYWNKKDYRLAADWLAKVKPGAPDYFESSFLLGLCRYYTADYAGAQTAFETVVKAVPLNEVYNDLGAAQSRRNLPEALANFQKAIEGDPADPDYHFNAGYALWKRGLFNEAAERFRAVLERNPEDSLSVLMLGKCLKNAGPRPGDPRSEGLERLKHNYEERAYRELKAALEVQVK